MSRAVVIVGLPVQMQSADQLALGPDASGAATVNGQRIRSLGHLPGDIAVVECADCIVLLPWALFNQLLNRAVDQTNLARGAP